MPITFAHQPGVGAPGEFGQAGAAAPGAPRLLLPVDQSKARSPPLLPGFLPAPVSSASRSFMRGAPPCKLAVSTRAEEVSAPYVTGFVSMLPPAADQSQAGAQPTLCVAISASTRSVACIFVAESTSAQRLCAVMRRPSSVTAAILQARLMKGSAAPLLRVGAAASGRRTWRTGAQPRSCASAPRLPERAAVGAAGSGALWPCPRVRRPSPWGLVLRWRTGTAAAVLLVTSSGHCRCNHTADAPSLGAVGRVGFGRLGFRVPRAAFALSATRSCGTRAGTLAPLSPFPGSCGLYQSSEASVVEAVG